MLTETRAKKKKSGMKPFEVKQAMVALGLEASDDYILDYVEFFARRIPTSAAYFLHVLPKFDLFNAIYEKETQSLVSNYELNEDVIAQMRNKIKDRVSNLRFGFDVREGDPLEQLLKSGDELNIDLAVIGQKSGVSHHGILAKNLARKVKCNALVIPDQAEPRISTILVPVDFSLNSIKAVQTALAIKERLGKETRIVCLNVYEMPNLSMYRVDRTKKKFKKLVEADRKDSFLDFIKTHVPESVDDVEVAVVEKDMQGVARRILDYAGENEVDFVVMGAKGHSKVELLLLGSVTEKMLSINEKIPTLIVK